jgi:hypothetical protein
LRQLPKVTVSDLGQLVSAQLGADIHGDTLTEL